MEGGTEFAVFILTHGRPRKVITYRTLRRQGYTGPIYLLVDNEDSTVAEYRELYGEQVIVFDKEAISHTFDEGDNFQDRRAVVYARNASFGIAAELGLSYFLMLDDDYTSFLFKFSADLEYREKPIKNLDRLFATVLTYYKSIPALTVALAQNGDFLGGEKSGMAAKVWAKRKAMNALFCSTHRPFQFFGRMNEDVNTYVTLGNRGELFLTVVNAAISHMQTQKTEGGMTGLYSDYGAYVKPFYSVMYAPSCVKIFQTGYRHIRIHHSIRWAHAVPCILSEEYCKTGRGAE